MGLRFTAPALAGLAALLALGGVPGVAHVVLLPAVLAGGMMILDAVSERVSKRGGNAEVVLAAGALVAILVAAAARSPLLALGAVAAGALRPLCAALRETALEPIPDEIAGY